MELLWGTRPPGSRGPKPALTVDRIVTTAIAMADGEGLEGLSMRGVADRLGVGAMSLYRYIPGKAELLDLMVDRACAATRSPEKPSKDWRTRLEHLARENRALYYRHPWLLQVFPGRPPLGPGILAKYEYELQSVEGIGLTDVEMDSVLTAVLEYARGSTAGAVEAAEAQVRTGQTDDQWWTALEPFIEKVFDADRYPLAARVGRAAAQEYGGSYDPGPAFEFGLMRLLDGIQDFVEKRAHRGRT